MEQKSWLWKKRTSEKINNRKSGILNEKALELERSLESLNGQLSSVQTESSAKDDLLEKQAKVAEEAIGGWEKAESEALYFKQQLEEALHQKEATEERMIEIDAALKECMQQLRVAKEDQQIIIDNASAKISREQEKVRKLEESLAETNRRLNELTTQYSNLGRILNLKEQLIKDLSESKLKLEATIAEVNCRFESSEKNNASLKYEVCILEKELQIRNQERDFNIRSADAAHRQQLESVKKIAKLESECQRLRVMLRKKLPGPAALAKMRSEVEILGGDSTEMRKTWSNFTAEPSRFGDLVSEDQYVLSNKAVASFGDRIRVLEEENKILRESLVKRNSELQSSHVMCARTESRLSQVESQLDELSKEQISRELARNSPLPYDLPLASVSEHGGNEDNISCTGSWASALISELETFKGGKKASPSCTSARASDLSLMDDFVEMEKLAIISAHTSIESSPVTSAGRKLCVPAVKEAMVVDNLSEATGKELVLVESLSNFNEENCGNQISYESFVKCPSWLQDILKVIIQKNHMTKRSFDDILEQVKSALSLDENSGETPLLDGVLHCNAGLQSREASLNSFGGTISTGLANRKNFERNNGDTEKQILKLIELIEGIVQKNVQINNLQHSVSGEDRENSLDNNSSALNSYVSRAFLWEGSELVLVLQHFVTVCRNLLSGKADLGKFTAEIISALDWIMNHCFSLQDVSDIKESIKKSFDSENLHGHNDLKLVIYPASEIDQRSTYEEQVDAKEFPISSSSPPKRVSVSTRTEDSSFKVRNEIERLKSEIIHVESRKKDSEERLKPLSIKNDAMASELQNSEKDILRFQEVDIANDSRGPIGDLIMNQKLVNEDNKLTVAKADLDVTHQNFSLLEVQMEEESNCCEELKATCPPKLQLQLESASFKGSSKHVNGEEKQFHQGNEITAASEKLVACQETILNLGKQLKALASPTSAQLIDKVLSPASVKPSPHSQSDDELKAQDSAASKDLELPNSKAILFPERVSPTAVACENPSLGLFNGQNVKKNQYPTNSLINIMMQAPVETPGITNGTKLMIVPKKQKGGLGLLKKLLLRNKKDVTKKLTFPVAS